jgi:phage shock protein A
MDNNVINELLALIDSMAERIETLEAAKDEQDAINSLLTQQIVTLDTRIREAQDGLQAMQSRETIKLGGIDYDLMAKLRRAE